MTTLRPLNLETDAPQYAALLSTNTHEPVTVERVYEWERDFPVDGIRGRTVAVDEHGTLLGSAQSYHVAHMPPRSFWVEVIVFPEYRCQGIGTRLYDDAVAFATAHDATRLYAEVREQNPAWLRFAQTRGFRIRRHIFESSLDLATFDEFHYAGVVDSVQAQGIRFFTLADVGNTDPHRRRLYEVNRRTALDIPGREGDFQRYEDFEKYVFQASWFRAEGQILAADADKWVGLAAVGYYKLTNSSYNMMTGVLSEYRGRKIGLALKLLAIRFARSLGTAYIRTNNDSENAPILAINTQLGYRPLPGSFELVRDLTG